MEGEDNQAFQDFHYNYLLQQQQQGLHQANHCYYTGGIEPSTILPWQLPPIHAGFNPVHLLCNAPGDDFAPPPPPAMLGRRPLQLAYEAAAAEHLGIGGLYISDDGRAASSPFVFNNELGRMTAQEIMDAKALAASKSHSEAERRRRERINNHLARLRSLLPNTTKVSSTYYINNIILYNLIDTMVYLLD